MRVADTGAVCDARRKLQCAAPVTATQFDSPEVQFCTMGQQEESNSGIGVPDTSKLGT
jgi:hypothetical protein